ncbi:MAG: AraC family transcriptional regulator [Bacteroidales bacterium]
MPSFLIILLFQHLWASSFSYILNEKSEEADLFLQQMEKSITEGHSLEERATVYRNYYQKILEAEKKYVFTPQQNIQLKKLQLRICAKDQVTINRHIQKMVDLALKSKNDSIILDTYKYVFTKQSQLENPEAALQTINTIQKYASENKLEINLDPYYINYGLVLIREDRMEESLKWLKKGRSQRMLNNYYRGMSQALVETEKYNEAILHVDSLWQRLKPLEQATSIAGYVKGKALEATGNTKEAVKWYQLVLHKIDSISNYQDGSIRYNKNQLKMLLNYASLLRDLGKTNEALAILNRPLELPESIEIQLNKSLVNKDYLIYPKWYQTMAECYRKLNDWSQAEKYEFLTDSIQKNTAITSYQIAQKLLKESQDNIYLENELLLQAHEATLSRYTRYLLWTIVCGLVIIISGGIIWWNERQKRIIRLFRELIIRKTRWDELHYLLSEQDIQNQPTNGCIPLGLLPAYTSETEQTDHDLKTNNQQQNYYRIYFRLLQIMDKEKPFLDPNLDLTSLSRLVGTNRSLLSATLNQQSQMNFNSWLAEYRVNFLIQQIELHPEKKMDDLASAAGFSSRTSFYRQFKQVTGLTPKQFLEKTT